MSETYPWFAFYKDAPARLTYPAESMYELLAKAAAKHPQATALEFMGRRTTYRQLLDAVEATARALLAAGVSRGEAVTVCMPNCPQAVFLFYAINRIGAVANMVHPLSASEELAFYLKDADSRRIFTLDLFVAKLDEVAEKLPDGLQIVVTSIGEALSPLKRVGYFLTRKSPRKTALDIIAWRDFLAAGRLTDAAPVVRRDTDEPAVILYSGGTTGTN
ncbi:MAG: AMP-binding protein, partial [Clostridia bacterium]|nr:AMP-binding protein [Clostridia bacterium]